jgi:hypothetical protein
MKSLAFFLVVLCALIVGSVSWETNAASGTRKQSAVTNFDRPVVLQGVTLKGQYLFVHDDAAMQRGETCTFVYEGNAPLRNKLVLPSTAFRSNARRRPTLSCEQSRLHQALLNCKSINLQETPRDMLYRLR